MADEKKKPEISNFALFEPHPDPFVHIIWIIFILLVIVYILNAFINMLTAAASATGGFAALLRRIGLFLLWLLTSWPMKLLGIVVTVVCVVLIIRYLRRLFMFRAENEKFWYPTPAPAAMPVNPMWQRVENHLQSPNENDWRQAIIEADIMLDGILQKMNLPGDTIGDKLKAVDKSAFLTLDNAWEAHKIRNQIAHEGSAYQLSARESKRVIELYKTVFEELQII